MTSMDELVEIMAKAAIDRQYHGKRRPAPHILVLLIAEARLDARAHLTALEAKGYRIVKTRPLDEFIAEMKARGTTSPALQGKENG